MNVTGVVVEYNPFHNGHMLHVTQSKQITNADLIVAVMSGNFLQRGEPALVSKWARTKMALNQDVDIVLELPYVYATQHAEMFAQGAISILNGIGVNCVAFGSESGEIDQFHTLYSFLQQHEYQFKKLIQEALDQGNSYPRSLALAFSKLENHNKVLDLSLPNNILGYHYVKAICEQKAKIKPYTIKRTTAHYHDKEISQQSIASATSIREQLLIQNENLSSIKHVVPPSSYDELLSYNKHYKGFHNWEKLFPYLKYKVTTSSALELAMIYEAEEGLQNRLIQVMKSSSSFKELMEKLKTKRYTWTRLQRFCLHTLTNTTKKEMADIGKTAPYIRILGMNSKGREWINSRKKQVEIPLVSTISKYKHPFIAIEARASACYSLGFSPSIQTKMITEEFSQPPIIVKEKV